MNVVGFRLWLRINVCLASLTTVRVSYLVLPCPPHNNVLISTPENTTTVFSACQLNGTWSPVSLTCMSQSGLLQGEHSDQHFTAHSHYPGLWFNIALVLDNSFVSELDKHHQDRTADRSDTIITISILSTIIILVVIGIIATVMVKRRKAALENARFDLRS